MLEGCGRDAVDLGRGVLEGLDGGGTRRSGFGTAEVKRSEGQLPRLSREGMKRDV